MRTKRYSAVKSMVGILVIVATIGVLSAKADFSPTNYSDLVIWLDAGQGVTTTGQNRVTEWADQSGSSNDASCPSSGWEPYYSAISGPNQSPVLQWTDIPQHEAMTLPTAAAPTGSHTIFIAYHATEEDAGRLITRSYMTQGLSLEMQSDNRLRYALEDSSAAVNVYVNDAAGMDNIVVARYDASTLGMELSLNGGTAETNSKTVSAIAYHANDLFSMGVPLRNDLAVGSADYRGHISEMIMYDRALTAEEQSAVRTYLQQKYTRESPSPDIWLRSDMGVITNASGSVGGWLDQSGNNNHATTNVWSGGHIPVLGVGSGPNGADVVTFDRSNSERMQLPNNAAPTGPHTVFIVYSSDDLADGNSQGILSRAYWYGSFSFGVQSAGGADRMKYTLGRSGIDATNVTSTVSVVGGYKLVTGRYDGTNMTLKIDGADEQSATYEAPNLVFDDRDQFGLGIAQTTNGVVASGLSGSIAEVILYDEALTADQENSVGLDLEVKYGLDTAYAPPLPERTIFFFR